MKAKILTVGTFNEDGQPVGWTFSGLGWQGVDAVDIQADESVIYAGYTVDELREIASSPIKE